MRALIGLNNNPHTPISQKIADDEVFRHFPGEGVDFFKSDLTDPTQIFDAHLLEETHLSPSTFHFSVGCYIKIQPLITSSYI